MELYSYLSIPVGYLLGSIPSAYIIGRLVGKVDIRVEGTSHVSATAVYRRLGWVPFILVIVIDVGKGALAVSAAGMITDNLIIVLASGFAAVVGHCWSIFIKFKGGLGATTIYGVLSGLVFWQLLIGLTIGGIFFFITRKSTLTTIIIVIIVSAILFIQDESLILVLFPISLIMVQFLKRLHTKRSGPADNYSNELFDDFKRTR